MSKLQKRSKKSLAARNLLFETVGVSDRNPPGDYKKKRSSPAKKVREFLEEVAVDLPGKDGVRRRDKTAQKILPKRVKRLHKQYNRLNPEHKVSRATFYRHIPSHIKTTTKQRFRQGLCEYCQSIDMKLDVVNKYMINPVDGRDALSDASLCAVPKLECYNRKCGQCGTQKVHDMLHVNLTVDGDTIVTFEEWDMVPNANGKGKRKDVVERQSTLDGLIDSLLKELESFSRHQLIFRWQFQQFRAAKLSLHENPQIALAICDFAEYFTCVHQDEVQSAHWGYTQVTLHPTACYFQCPNPGCNSIVTQYLVYMSDEPLKDAALAKEVLDQIQHWLVQNVPGLSDLIVFSDGCAAQFKSRLPLFHLANATGPLTVTRAYFGSRHGKSPCDSCGGVVKCCVEEDVKSGEVKVRNAAEMHQHCAANMSLPEDDAEPGQCCHLRRNFFLIERDSIDRSVSSSDVATVPGTRLLHSVQGVGKPNTIQTRKFACFCSACLKSSFDQCENKHMVDEWETVMLKCGTSSREAPESVSGLNDNAVPDLDTAAVQAPKPSDSAALPRASFFSNLYRQINNCASIEELKVLAASVAPDVEKYDLPLQDTTVTSVRGVVDRQALSLRPENLSTLFPVVTGADGNCLPRSLSTIVFGKEKHHIEMRCRLVLELAEHFSFYVAGEGMGSDGAWVVSFLCVLAEGSGFALDAVHTVTPYDVEEALKRDILDVRKKTVNMCLWHLAAAANVLRRPVHSIYPDKGYGGHHRLNNRIIYPRASGAEVAASPCFIMWTSTRDDMSNNHWIANHFVPLLPITTPNATVVVDTDPFTTYNRLSLADVSLSDLFFVTWNGEDLVARVDNIFDDGTLLLNFMVWDKGLCTWPNTPDTSNESVGVLKERVCLELVPGKSSQRRQYYTVV